LKEMVDKDHLDHCRAGQVIEAQAVVEQA
jgi:hypothetical protein